MESVLSDQHPQSDARCRRRTVRGRIREIHRSSLSSHVGRAEEDGRSRGGAEGIGGVRPRCGKAVRPRARRRRQGEADRKHPIGGRARRLRLADVLCRQGDVFRQGAAARGRGIGFGEVNRAVIASEAKQSIRQQGSQSGLLRFARNDDAWRTSMQKRNATAAVIGAGDYIGAEIAKKFAAEGFTVFAGRRDGAKLEPLIRDIEAAGGSIVARALDARKEEEVTAFLNDADKHAPLEVCIFNIGANVNFPILETTDRVFRKVWEMACWAGFVSGRESARLMVPRGQGNIFFTGATASLRGGSGFAAFASAKFGLRAVAQAMARELGPQNIHVAHLIIDSGVDTAWVRERREQLWGKEALDNPDLLMPPASVANAYWQLYQQPKSAWTFELEIRPFGEKW